MALHLLHAGRLARKLAADAVTPWEQAAYFAATYVVWLVTSYLLNLPPAAGTVDAFLSRGLYLGEFAMLVVINCVGAFHCLRQCLHEPRRHFLVDLTCLMAPATVLALLVSWLVYFGAIWGYYLVLRAMPDTQGLSTTAYWKVHDLLRYFVVVGQVALSYFIAGRYMRRAAVERLEAR